MSEVASLELCEELYKLTRWNHTEFLWVAPPLGDEYMVMHKSELHRLNDDPSLGSAMYNSTFAYTAGYLLRKLPPSIPGVGEISMDYGYAKGRCVYRFKYNDNLQAYADTPEDALCKLAIELAKQGLLEKEQP